MEKLKVDVTESPKPTKPQPEASPKPSKASKDLDTSLNDSVTASPAPAKKNNSYWAYKNREGPKNPGSKEIPEVRDHAQLYCSRSLVQSP